jgi:hypothetical protein
MPERIMDPLGASLDEIETAEQRAALCTPRPAYEPVHAGAVGVLVVALVLAAYIGIAAIASNRFLIAACATLAMGFVLPYLYFQGQQRRHTSAVLHELQVVRRERSKRESGDLVAPSWEQ